MRRWGILLGVVVLVFVGALVIAALNLNRFLNQNRELIAKQAQRAIGREVRFGDAGVSFAGGLGVRVEDLHVADDPALSKEDFVSAETVDVGVKILPALSGRIELARRASLALDHRDPDEPGQRLDIAKLSLDAFEGALSASGSYDMKNAQRPSFDLRTELADMRIERISENQAPATAHPAAPAAVRD